jgi:hypothetical protein
MILDWDVHHGNGTQAIFWEDPSVLLVDIHQADVWPGSGGLEETGAGGARPEGWGADAVTTAVPCWAIYLQWATETKSNTLLPAGTVQHTQACQQLAGTLA